MKLKNIILICFFTVTCISAQIEVQELGRFGGTGSKPGQFKNPSAIDVNDAGKVFVCDRGNNRIQVFDERGFFVKDIGGFGSQADQFDEPMDVWARNTLNIFVADYNNRRIQRFDRELNFISAFYSNEGNDDRFQFEEVLSVAHSSQGDLFILESGENKVIKFQRETAQTSFGYFDSGVGELIEPVQIDLTYDENILVSDLGNTCVNVYDYFGNFLKRLTHESMKNPSGLSVDNKNRIYIADKGAKTVFIIEENGKLISEIKSISGKNLIFPVDICVRSDNHNSYKGYLIDENEVIIFNLKFKKAPE